MKSEIDFKMLSHITNDAKITLFVKHSDMPHFDIVILLKFVANITKGYQIIGQNVREHRNFANIYPLYSQTHTLDLVL